MGEEKDEKGDGPENRKEVGCHENTLLPYGFPDLGGDLAHDFPFRSWI